MNVFLDKYRYIVNLYTDTMYLLDFMSDSFTYIIRRNLQKQDFIEHF